MLPRGRARRALRRRCARRRATSSSWARTSPRWAARWASPPGCSTSSGRSACATRRSRRWRSSARGSGAAMQGMRPVVEIMYEDFTTLAMEQIVNQAAKHRSMSGGQLKVPLTIRTQGGAGWSPGAQHAQQLEALVRPRARAEGRLRLDADRRARPALVGDLRRQPGDVLRAPHALRDQGGGSRRARADPDRQGPRAPRGRGRDRGRDRPARARGARRGRGGRGRRASRWRSSTRARCSRSTRRGSSRRSRRRTAAWSPTRR